MPAFTDNFPRYQSYVLKAPLYPKPPVVKKRPRRPNFPYEFKIALVEQSLQPGACVAQIARENGINDNLLFNWRLINTGNCMPSRQRSGAVQQNSVWRQEKPEPRH